MFCAFNDNTRISPAGSPVVSEPEITVRRPEADPPASLRPVEVAALEEEAVDLEEAEVRTTSCFTITQLKITYGSF